MGVDFIRGVEPHTNNEKGGLVDVVKPPPFRKERASAAPKLSFALASHSRVQHARPCNGYRQNSQTIRSDAPGVGRDEPLPLADWMHPVRPVARNVGRSALTMLVLRSELFASTANHEFKQQFGSLELGISIISFERTGKWKNRLAPIGVSEAAAPKAAARRAFRSGRDAVASWLASIPLLPFLWRARAAIDSRAHKRNVCVQL
jgi:hypothetical protein